MDEKNIRLKKALNILEFIVFLLIILGIPAYLYFFRSDLLENFKSLEGITAFLEKYHRESIFVYIAIQVLQIIISVIPGQAIQIAAGLLYGFIPALIYSIIGAALGTTLSFYIARLLGKGAVELFVKPETIDEYMVRLNSKKAYASVFFLYLIPGLPKDVISYVAGISQMRYKAFLILSLAGRLPAMAASILIGKHYGEGNYLIVGILAGIGLIAFIICIIFRKKLMPLVDKIYEKLVN